MIDVSKMNHNVRRIKSALQTLPDGKVIAKEKLKAYIPKQFEKSRLAEIYDYVSTIMMVGLVIGNDYCVLAGLTHIVLRPGEIYEESIDGDRYYVMDFEPGDVVIDSLTVPQDNNIGYYHYLEFTKYGRRPWYLSPEIVLACFDESKYYTGKGTGGSPQAIRVLYALVQRDPKDLGIPFRYSPYMKDPNVKPVVIGINNPGALLNSTFSRLTSGYMADNIVAGILNPDTKVTVLEEVIRGLPEQLGDGSNV